MFANPPASPTVTIQEQTDPTSLFINAKRVIDEALELGRGLRTLAPLFSGGHDSYCACFIASKHRCFSGDVYHIDTGIGSKKTREFVEKVCRDEGWRLNVMKSHVWTFEKFIRKQGFPGPGYHQFVYNWLKDKCIDQITRVGHKHHRTLLITGCRSQESTRRMGHVEKIKIGEKSKNTGEVRRKHRIWVSPCHDWSTQDQQAFMNAYALPRNPVKDSLLAMSGECFCGAFARPYELDMIRDICPDVAEKIDYLQVLAQECGYPANKCVYGGPRDRKKIDVLETGPLCNSCDARAAGANIEIVEDM